MAAQAGGEHCDWGKHNVPAAQSQASMLLLDSLALSAGTPACGQATVPGLVQSTTRFLITLFPTQESPVVERLLHGSVVLQTSPPPTL
jgi:hypothetical protein